MAFVRRKGSRNRPLLYIVHRHLPTVRLVAYSQHTLRGTHVKASNYE